MVPDALINDDVLIGSDVLCNVDIKIKSGKIISIAKVVTEPDEAHFVNKIEVISNVDEVDLTHISNENHRKELQQTISNYKPLKTKDVGIKLRIVVRDDIPIYQQARRLAPQELKLVDSQIQTWLAEGIIRPSYSNYASPIVLVKKRTGPHGYV